MVEHPKVKLYCERLSSRRRTHRCPGTPFLRLSVHFAFFFLSSFSACWLCHIVKPVTVFPLSIITFRPSLYVLGHYISINIGTEFMRREIVVLQRDNGGYRRLSSKSLFQKLWRYFCIYHLPDHLHLTRQGHESSQNKHILYKWVDIESERNVHLTASTASS